MRAGELSCYTILECSTNIKQSKLCMKFHIFVEAAVLVIASHRPVRIICVLIEILFGLLQDRTSCYFHL